MPIRKLYFGDNLEIMREHVGDESVDLVYLDPPFNSNQSYNVLFKERDTRPSQAQIEAFDDTWHWTPDTQHQFENLMLDSDVPRELAKGLDAFRIMLQDEHGSRTKPLTRAFACKNRRYIELGECPVRKCAVIRASDHTDCLWQVLGSVPRG